MKDMKDEKFWTSSFPFFTNIYKDYLKSVTTTYIVTEDNVKKFEKVL
ncbi:MAG: hypothetical protein QW250_07295 [Sulfolobaceae archaeon]